MRHGRQFIAMMMALTIIISSTQIPSFARNHFGTKVTEEQQTELTIEAEKDADAVEDPDAEEDAAEAVTGEVEAGDTEQDSDAGTLRENKEQGQDTQQSDQEILPGNHETDAGNVGMTISDSDNMDQQDNEFADDTRESVIQDTTSEKADEAHKQENTQTTTTDEEEIIIVEPEQTSDASNEAEDVFTITYDANGGFFGYYDEEKEEWRTDKKTIIKSVQKGDTLEYVSAESDDPDYYCSGWTIGKNGDVLEDTYGYEPDRDMTLYAVWSKYNIVTLDANGGIFPDVCDFETKNDGKIGIFRIKPGEVDAPYDIPHYENDSMWIKGWSREKNGPLIIYQTENGSHEYSNDFDLNDGDTLYAVWGKTVTITLEANGGYFEGEWDYENDEYKHVSRKIVKGPAGEEMHIRFPENDNGEMICAGWSTQLSGRLSTRHERISTQEDLTLYAVWGKAIIITFDMNGGYCADGVYDEVSDRYIENGNKFRKKIISGDSVSVDISYNNPVYGDAGSPKAFAGWSLTKNGVPLNIDKMGGTYEPKDSCTLYAVWKDPIIITFDMNGGHCSEDVYDDVKRTYIEDASKFQKIVVPGEEVSVYSEQYGPVSNDNTTFFAGWSLTKNGEPINDNYSYKPESTCTLYAVWNKPILVTFDANGGEFASEAYDDVKEEYVESVSSFTKKVLPTENIFVKVNKDSARIGDENIQMKNSEGKLFTGWSLDKKEKPMRPLGRYGEELWHTIPKKSCTLYAVWKDTCIVQLDPLTGNIKEKERWGYDPNDPEDIGNTIADYAQDGNTITIETVPGEHVFLPEAESSDEDLIFAGWCTEKDKNVNPVMLGMVNMYYVTGGCTLYAKWVKPLKVTWDAGDGYFDRNGKKERVWVEKIIPGDHLGNPYVHTDVPGKDIVGWSLTPGGEIVYRPYCLPDFKPEEDTTLYAVWGKVQTITYDANGGYFQGTYHNWDEGVSEELDGDTKLEVPYTEGSDRVYQPGELLRTDKEGVVFAGWGTTKNGNFVFLDDISNTDHVDRALFSGSLPTGDFTLYAVWKKPDCKITLDGNGGMFRPYGEESTTTYVINTVNGKRILIDAYYLDHPNDNKVLAGFSLAKNSNDVVTDPYDDAADWFFYTAEKSCTLYAVWSDPCTITIDANGGYFPGDIYDEDTEECYEYTSNRVVLHRPGALYRKFDTGNYGNLAANKDSNLRFLGWSFTKTGKVDVKSGDSFIPSGDTTIYAVWGTESTVKSIKIDTQSVQILTGGTKELHVQTDPSNATGVAVQWSSDNTKVATVDQNGKVTGLGVGNATITAAISTDNSIKATCTVTVKEAPTFKDVSPSYAFTKEIQWAAANGIVSGYADGTFKPQDNCKRKQVVAFLWRMNGSPAPKSTKARFSDVSTKTDFYKGIYWASENNIVLGFGNGTFKPDDTCTRGQVVAFLWRLAGRPAPKSTSSKFSDVTKTHSFYKAILWASEKGIVKGYSDGSFKPDNNCTRAQIVAFINRYCNLK